MARLAHATRTASALGALLIGMAVACSVDHSGLGSGAGGDATSGMSGAAGTRAAGGTAGGGTGGAVAGAGGVGAGGGGVAGAGAAGTGVAGAGAAGTGVAGAGVAGTGAAGTGAAGTGAAGAGAAGTGAAGDGGMAGGETAGSNGTAGAGVGGGGTGGSAPGGSGGVAGGAGVGGGAGLGGSGGGGGAGGRGGAGGVGGRGGSGGAGGTVSCAKYPAGMAFTTPTDGKGHCYWLHIDRQTWPTARMRCQSDGGDLVTILSAAENQFVLSIGRFTNSPPELWLGGTDGKMGSDRTGPGTYRWVTNETWSYTNWNLTPPAQPDGFCDPCSAGQTCTCDHRATMAMDGTWYDFWQDNPRGYVCEAVP